MDSISFERNVNDLLNNTTKLVDQQENQIECFRICLKRKLFELTAEDDKAIDYLTDEDDCLKIKRFKNNLENKSTVIKSASSEIPLTTRNQFKKRVLKSYSNKKLLKSKRKRSFSKPFLNLNNLTFDTKSAYKFKFEQIVKKVFEKINNCTLDEHQLNNDEDKNILDLNQLFQFSDSNLDTILDDNLMQSLKASFLGRGSFGKVFKTKLEQKSFAIKIGLSNSCYGLTGEQNALLNEHPNVVKTYHILKLKLTNEDKLLKRKAVDDEFPIFMNTNISYHTIKHIIDLNLLKLIDLFPKHKLYSTLNVIIMEFAGDFSLQQLIDDSKDQKITKSRRINFAKQIADALVYLKNKSIAHLDLKPANIMIRKNDDFLKLIDFGCSKKCYPQVDEVIGLNRFKSFDEPFSNSDMNEDKENKIINFSSSFKANATNKYLNLENSIMSSLIKNGKKLIGQNNCNIGTISHTAPEIFRNETVKNIFQADVYSFSIILWQLVTREVPYEGNNIHSIIYRVASGKLRPKFDPLFHLEEKNYFELTVKMWHNLPEHRPNIESIFQTLNKRF